MTRFLLVSLLVFAFIFLSTASSFAAESTFWGQIVPRCGTTGECNICDLALLAQNVMNALIVFSVIVAAGLFAWAGVLMITAQDNQGQRDKAKGVLWNVVIGLVVLLGAWLFIDTLMKTFLKDPNGNIGSLGPWNKVLCKAGFTPTVGSAPVYGTATEGGTVVQTTGGISHDSAMAQFRAADITVTSTSGLGGVSGTCSGTGCTNCSGLQQGTVDQVINIANACGPSSTIVTGCTEGGHAEGGMSHSSGFKIDLDDTYFMNSCLQRNLTSAGTRSGDPRYVDKCNNEYVHESTHWDITVTSRCTLDMSHK